MTPRANPSRTKLAVSRLIGISPLFFLAFCFPAVIFSAEPEYEFKMAVDENGSPGGNGEYLWSEKANWNAAPLPNGHVNIGNAEPVVHCVIKKHSAECGQLDLSEAGGPKGGVGNSLTIKDGGSLTVNKNFYCGKDKRGFLYIKDGGRLQTKAKTIVGFNRSTLGTNILMDGGEFTARTIILAATSPLVTEASTMAVSGGSLFVSDLLNVNSSKPELPGILKISGTASVNISPSKGITSIGYGVLNIDGGLIAELSLGDLKFEQQTGSKLLLSGSSIKTISADKASINNALLDVSTLKLKPGDYTIIKAQTISGKFTTQDDFAKSWTISYDYQNGLVILTRLAN